MKRDDQGGSHASFMSGGNTGRLHPFQAFDQPGRRKWHQEDGEPRYGTQELLNSFLRLNLNNPLTSARPLLPEPPMMTAERMPFASTQAVQTTTAARSRAVSRAWSVRRWAGAEYDFRLLCVLSFALCVLGIGWTGILMPQWSPAGMISGGNQSPEDGPPMVELAPSQDSPAQDVQPPAEEPTPPEALETPPEPVPVLVKDAAFVIPAPPETVKALAVSEAAPDKPKPSPQPLPRHTGPVSSAPAAPAGPSSGPGLAVKAGKPKTPMPPYPSFAKSAKMTGTVVVSLVVDSSGSVSSASVARSCGFPELDRHTCDYILRAWHWPEGGRRTFTQNVQYRLR
jgi:TonB family protein